MTDKARSRWTWLTVALLAGAAAAIWVVVAGDASADTERWHAVENSPFVRRVPAGGELRSADSSRVGCPPVQRKWNFTITSMAPEGSEVKAGQPVLGFDAKEIFERMQLLRTRLDTARSRLERTRIEQREQRQRLVVERAEAVAVLARLEQKLDVPANLEARVEIEKLRLDKGLADEVLRLIDLRTQAAEDNERALIRSARSSVSKLERELVQTEASIAAHNVSAPRDGFVVHIGDWEGKKPKVGESVFIGQPVMEVADLSRMEISAEVAEPDARWVEEGQQVEIRLDAAPDRIFVGRIVRLGHLFREKSAEVPKMVFDVIVEIAEPDPDLMRPGMAASVEILAPTAESVIQIPESAVRLESGLPVVTVESDGSGRSTQPVTLGDRWQGSVIVLDGLQSGDRVIVGGATG